jgi:hypothetical protein
VKTSYDRRLVPPSVGMAVEIGADFARFAPRGEVTLVEAVDAITDAIAFCRARSVGRLLIDTTGLTGFSSPTLVDRFLMVQDWAEVGKGGVDVVLIADATHIHPRKFGVMAATDAGLTAEVFASEREAVEWLTRT